MPRPLCAPPEALKAQNMADEKKVYVTKDMVVGEIISKYPDAAFALMQCGMGCISCPASQAESLQDASMVHGMNADEVVDYVNEYLQFQESQKEAGKAE